MTATAGVLANAAGTTMANTTCTGFTADVTSGLACTYYYDNIPTVPTAGSDTTGIECYRRNLSVLAETYSNSIVATTTDSAGDWDSFNTAITNWATAYESLIDKRLDLDVASDYLTKLGVTVGLTASDLGVVTDAVSVDGSASYGVDGYK